MPLEVKKVGKFWHIKGTVAGVRIRESARTTNKAIAERKARELEREIEERAYLGTDSATFSDAVQYYLEKGGEARFLMPIHERFGMKKLKEITPLDVSAFAEERYGHLEPASVKRQLYTPLNAVMRAAYNARLAPLIRFDPPKVKRKEVDYATDDWFRLFFQYAGPRITITVLFLTMTGARVSEACRLVPADIDFDKNQAVLRKTKSGKSRRVTLPPDMTEALRRWIATNNIGPFQPVFGYSDRFSVNQAIERVCDRINVAHGAIRWKYKKDAETGKHKRIKEVIGHPVIDYKSSHKIGRHAFAARLLAEGNSLKLVQEAGGWASIQIVAETYGHLEQSSIDEQVRAASSGLLTKMGSGRLALPSPETDWQDSDKLAEGESGETEKTLKNLVGATGIEPVTPTMSRMTIEPENAPKHSENKGFSENVAEGTRQELDGNMS